MMFFCQNTLRSQNSKQLLNQKGQISVFLALGFLVLFTMFGMTINIAMVVHDKIVLQNAADFASIYVAQRQAEQLNAIAHFNYQIRQAHKLLAYRYVVLGTAGIDVDRQQLFPETLDPYAEKLRYPFCIADDKILEFPLGNSDNYCAINRYNSAFSGIPILDIHNPSLGTNYGLKSQTEQIAREIIKSFGRASVINWWFVANSMASFKNQVSYRKSMIRALANNLVKPIQPGNGGMKDLAGESVYEGAQKTFEYNLSESIRRRGGYSIQIRNSLDGVDHKQWLPEMKTFIIPTYGEYVSTGGPGAASAIMHRHYFYYPQEYLNNSATQASIDSNFFSVVNPNKFLIDMAGYSFPEDDDLEDILGFEKNPWYMVYNHVEAQASSGALFSPVPGTSLYAQAFSKPFGGQIGPWYSKDWSQGSPNSTGEKTERLWPNRKVSGYSPLGTADPTILPNAPKYPGDSLGFSSMLAQASTGLLGGRSRNRIDINAYINVTLNQFPGSNGQTLADGVAGDREAAAIAPDLFDITYYSIEPNFNINYLENKLDNWLLNEARFSRPNLTYTGKIWRDLGYSTEPARQTITVKDQLMIQPRQTFGRQVFYFLNSNNDGLANILTSWVGGTDVVDYRSPASGSVRDRFGKCQNFHPNTGPKPHIPGECLNGGGRTGYSVKMVSKEYLLSNQHQMSQNSTGAILNPPKDFSP